MEPCISCIYLTYCMKYMWKYSLWIGIFQRATRQARILLTNNIQIRAGAAVVSTITRRILPYNHGPGSFHPTDFRTDQLILFYKNPLPAQRPYQIGCLFTQQESDFSVQVFVMEWSCTTPILKIDCHIQFTYSYRFQCYSLATLCRPVSSIIKAPQSAEQRSWV